MKTERRFIKLCKFLFLSSVTTVSSVVNTPICLIAAFQRWFFSEDFSLCSFALSRHLVIAEFIDQQPPTRRDHNRCSRFFDNGRTFQDGTAAEAFAFVYIRGDFSSIENHRASFLAWSFLLALDATALKCAGLCVRTIAVKRQCNASTAWPGRLYP